MIPVQHYRRITMEKPKCTTPGRTPVRGRNEGPRRAGDAAHEGHGGARRAYREPGVARRAYREPGVAGARRATTA